MADFARESALKILYKIEEESGYSNLVLDEYLNKHREKLSAKDINLISELVYGTITWKLTLDSVIQKYSKVKLKKISVWVMSILRMGAYQILFLDRIPKSAAVNESVNLTKKYAYKSASFVNAILRKIEKADYEDLANIENLVERISKKYSMPEWLIEEFQKEYSAQEIEQICIHSNQKPKMTIRINSLKISREDFVQKLKERQIEYEEMDGSNFIHIKNAKNMAQWDLFRNGYFTVQDIGAGKVVEVLCPKPGQMVLDACSAPGGKTTYLAEMMNNQGKIEAWDVYEHRIQLVEENAKRLGIDIIETKQKNATELEEENLEKFDKVLLDVPCFGFGVMKRKPDIKWKRKKEDFEEIVEVQYRILDVGSKYLKVGGELVYSTCSILKRENEDIIKNWINRNDLEGVKFKIVSQEKILPQENCDGFFICKIKRIL